MCYSSMGYISWHSWGLIPNIIYDI
jgi:hypothetical protein